MFEAPFPPYDPTDKTRFVLHPRNKLGFITESQHHHTHVARPAASGTCCQTSLPQIAHFIIPFLVSYVTVLKRWPVILTQIIDTIYHADHDLGISLASIESAAEKSKVEEKIEEGKAIISKISQVKYEMARNRPLEWVLSTSCTGRSHLYEKTDTSGRRGDG